MQKQKQVESLPTGGQDGSEQDMRLLELCQVITDAQAAGLTELAARWYAVATSGQPLSLETIENAEGELRAARGAA